MAKLLAPFNSKAALWVKGRKGLIQRIETALQFNDQPIIWMHAASLGEFEQGLPVVELIKKQYPHHRILVTFFSPSGYEVRKNHPLADWIFYLPMDSPSNAAEFIAIVKPSIALFIKYEFWHFYLANLKKRNIPTILASGLFRKSQPFFQFWGSFHRKMLQSFTFFFVQDENSRRLLQNIGYKKNVMVSGDTRFDRVYQIAKENVPIDFAEKFCTGKTLIAGSTWPEDETLLKEWHQLQQEWKLVIAPHEISAAHIQHLKRLFPNAVCLSEISTTTIEFQTNVLIVDAMGILSRLYWYGSLSYVGGGLKKSGHHNILEAAVYGKAVVTGPYIHKFSESVALCQMKGSFIVHNGKDLYAITNNSELYEKAGEKARTFVQMNLGATEKIINWIDEYALAKNNPPIQTASGDEHIIK